MKKVTKTIAAALLALQNPSGDIRPQDVIDAAKNPTSPLHKRFQWDVQKAAQANWLSTAKELIREVRVFVKVHETSRTIAVKRYVSTPLPKIGSRYRNTEKVKGDQILRSLLTQTQATRGHVETVRNLAEYWGVDAELLSEALENIDRFTALMNVQLVAKKKPRRKGKGGDELRV